MMVRKKIWTLEAEYVLTKCYATSTISELSILLPEFTAAQIRNKAAKLGLQKEAATRRAILLCNALRSISAMHSEAARSKKSKSIRKMIQRERLRVKYGLPQRTKRAISLLSLKEQRKYSKIRYTLRQRGYIYAGGFAFQYDSDTQRSLELEERYNAYGFNFQAIQ
jgi:hypothetical protein